MRITTRNMILTAFFAGLTAIGAVLIEIPIGPAPITLQVLFTTLAGVVLGAKLGALSQIVYVFMGLVGLPVFSGGSGGPAYIFHPTFGYMMGFILSAYVIGKICEKQKHPKFINLFLASLAGLAVIYAIGFPYLYFVLAKINNLDVTFYGVLKSSVLVFIPWDILKCILTALLGVRIIPLLRKENLGI